jgi:hypothetical protein
MIHDFELDGPAFLIVLPSPRRRWWMTIRGLQTLVFVLGCFFCLGLTVISWPTCCGEAPRRVQCVNNLKQITLALHAYHERYGSFPPAYVADASGRRMHSWRVLILPFLEQSALHERYDFNEPWNGPHNIRLVDEMPYVFDCPSRYPAPKGRTSYVVITGPGTMFPGVRSVKYTDVTDGGSCSLAVVETANTAIPWTAPVDLDIRTMSFRLNEPGRLGLSSKHPGGANFTCGDGHAGFMKQTIDPKRLRELVTIADGNGNNGDQSF